MKFLLPLIPLVIAFGSIAVINMSNEHDQNRAIELRQRSAQASIVDAQADAARARAEAEQYKAELEKERLKEAINESRNSKPVASVQTTESSEAGSAANGK